MNNIIHYYILYQSIYYGRKIHYQVNIYFIIILNVHLFYYAHSINYFRYFPNLYFKVSTKIIQEFFDFY